MRDRLVVGFHSQRVVQIVQRSSPAARISTGKVFCLPPTTVSVISVGAAGLEYGIDIEHHHVEAAGAKLSLSPALTST